MNCNVKDVMAGLPRRITKVEPPNRGRYSIIYKCEKWEDAIIARLSPQCNTINSIGPWPPFLVHLFVVYWDYSSDRQGLFLISN